VCVIIAAVSYFNTHLDDILLTCWLGSPERFKEEKW